jgi:hypothetical protein
MAKRYIGGLIVLALGLALMACHILDNYTLYLNYGVQEGLMIVHSLPIGVALLMLLRCKRSNVMADPSAAVAGCLYGVCLGSVYPAFVAMLWFADGEPVDGIGVIFFLAALLLTVLVCVMDCLQNKKKLSFRRFLLEACIAGSLIGPMFVPAYRVITACIVWVD